MNTEPSTQPDRPFWPNIIVLVVITVSMLAFPVRKLLSLRNDPARVATVRGRVLAQAFDKVAVTNRASADTILRAVDPHLGLSTLPGIAKRDGIPVIAWNVVDLPPDAPRDMPLLISHNVVADSLASLTGRISDVVVDTPPFGTNTVIIIFRNGHGITLGGEALAYTWLPHFGGKVLTNRIFRP